MADTKKKTNRKYNIENLKPCKPGETHNPNGRPRGVKNWDVVMRELFEKGEYNQEDLIKIYIEKAADGDQKAMDFLAERMDGKAKERLGISIDDSEITKKLKDIFVGHSTENIQ